MTDKQKKHQKDLAEQARQAAAKARGTGTRQGQATGSFFDKLARAHEQAAR